MLKKILLLIIFLFIVSQAHAATQYYYLRAKGAGSNSNDSGTWEKVPSIDENAMSANNFNDLTNWSDTDSENKIDSDDIIFVKGDGWNSSSYNLKPIKGITLDFYEEGDFDYQTMDHTIEPCFTYSKIIITTDNVKILDGRFNKEWYGSGRSIDAATYNSGKKIANLTVQRCVFNAVDQYSCVHLGFVCDSDISYNYFAAKLRDSCPGAGRAIAIHGGSRNKFMYNEIYGKGYTAIIFWAKRDWTGDGILDIPSYESYAADPDFNLEDNEVAYNYIHNRCEEGISYDVASSNDQVTIVERDEVVTVNGTTVTLNNAGGEGPGGEWTGVGNLYSGYYMTAITDKNDVFGKHALIISQNDNTFQLSNEIENLKKGDIVVIGFTFRHNWIHNNTFEYGGTADSYILLEGMALENLVENNEIPADPYTKSGGGIKVSSLYQYNKATGNVTETYASEPAAYNIIRNNTCGAIVSISWGKNYGPGDLFFTRNNAFINNTLLQTYYTRTLDLKWSTAYLFTNNGDYKLLLGSSLLESDPTTEVLKYFENWGNKEKIKVLYAPNNVKVNP